MGASYKAGEGNLVTLRQKGLRTCPSFLLPSFYFSALAAAIP
jgi:hypothetical protein